MNLSKENLSLSTIAEEKQNIMASITKPHFAKLHENVSSKYIAMQKKLQRTKSTDSIYSTSSKNSQESFSICNEKETMKYTIQGRLVEKEISRECIVVDSIEAKDAFIEEIFFSEEHNIDEPVSNILKEDGYESDQFSIKENEDLKNTFSKSSRESLSNISRESEETLSSSPPPKVSMRERIRSRLLAAKEKRNKEKNHVREIQNEKQDKVEKFVFSNTKQETIKLPSKKVKLATVTIGLIEAKVPKLTVDVNVHHKIKNDVYQCRIRLGYEKYKSKIVKRNSDKVEWLEQTNLNMYEDFELEICILEKDNFIAKTTVDISDFKKEKTHRLQLKMNEVPEIEVFLLLTITGTTQEFMNLNVDEYLRFLSDFEVMDNKKLNDLRLSSDACVGYLSVLLCGAKGMPASDCYCVLQLDNEIRQTQTEHKTIEPLWMKRFDFAITDITSILELTVTDERRSEEIGKLSIALLGIINGQRKWYALKDSNLKERAKGQNPRILIEMKITWNLVKASLKVIKPKEEKYLQTEEKLDRKVFMNNLSRTKTVVFWVLETFEMFKTCFEWESTRTNLIALIGWLILCSCFKVWMVPLMLLIPFLRFMPDEYCYLDWRRRLSKLNIIPKKIQVEEDEDKTDEKTSLFQKINSFQETLQTTQNAFGSFASFSERVKNLFNFTVPYVSCLAIFFIMIFAILTYLVPLQYLLMIWSIYKFLRRKIRPNFVPNSEIMDLISRVLDDETLQNCQPLPDEDNNS